MSERIQSDGRALFPSRTVRSLYPLAMAEGEGVGTAYEYFAKRLRLRRWLADLPRPEKLLIAGLPEKYGSSLDFFLVAEDLRIPHVVVADDRASALEKCRNSLAVATSAAALTQVRPDFVLAKEMAGLQELGTDFQLCLSSEVVQRLEPECRPSYMACLAEAAPCVAIFAPNGDNQSHATLSGLSGLTLTELRDLANATTEIAESGYVDMPPFPPGLTRSTEQRQQAASGHVEALAMWALGWYARGERLLPGELRRRHSHIAYAFLRRPASGSR